jgi:hypothetical protein
VRASAASALAAHSWSNVLWVAIASLGEGPSAETDARRLSHLGHAFGESSGAPAS